MADWTEPQLFDPGEPTHRKRLLGKAFVRLEVSVTVEVDLDDKDAIEHLAKINDADWKPATAKDLVWAVGNAGWVIAADDLCLAIDWYVEDVDHVQMPRGLDADVVLAEWLEPTYEEIGGQA